MNILLISFKNKNIKNKNTTAHEWKDFIDLRNSLQMCKCKLWKRLNSLLGFILKGDKWVFLWGIRCVIVLAFSKSLPLALSFQVGKGGSEPRVSVARHHRPFYSEVCAVGDKGAWTGELFCHNDMLTAPPVCLEKFRRNYIYVLQERLHCFLHNWHIWCCCTKSLTISDMRQMDSMETEIFWEWYTLISKIYLMQRT